LLFSHSRSVYGTWDQRDQGYQAVDPQSQVYRNKKQENSQFVPANHLLETMFQKLNQFDLTGPGAFAFLLLKISFQSYGN